MKRIISKIIKSFWCALRGLQHAYRSELSFRLEIGGGALLAFIVFFFWPLTKVELLFLILSFCLVLAMELHNTALERVWERLHPEHHDLVGASKDVASAAVFIAVVFAGCVVIVIALSRLHV